MRTTRNWRLHVNAQSHRGDTSWWRLEISVPDDAYTTTTYYLNSCACPDSRDSTGLRQATISPPHLRQPAIAPTLREDILTVLVLMLTPSAVLLPVQTNWTLQSSHARETANAGACRQARLTSSKGANLANICAINYD